MVRSEQFTGLISVIVGTDLEGVISFLRSEGVNVSLSAKPTEVTSILVYSLANSEVLKQSFISWADSRYKNTTQSNYSGENYASGFDPMATQGSGQEFDAMSSQQGANLKEWIVKVEDFVQWKLNTQIFWVIKMEKRVIHHTTQM